MPAKSVKERISRALLPVAVLAAGVCAGAVVYTTKPPVEEEPPEIKPRAVNTMAVEVRAVSMTVASQGAMEARQAVNLVPQVSGAITWVSDKFVNGGMFAEGEHILQIDPRDYELAVVSAEARVADAAQQLETVRAQAEQAAAEWKQLDRGTPTALALRKPQLAGAEAALKSAEAELVKARLQLERTHISAPFNGIIIAKQVDRGQFVTSGSQLAEIASADEMEIRLSLPEREVVKLDQQKMRDQGLKVRLASLTGESGQIWEGLVVRAEGRIDPKTRNTVVVAQLNGRQLLAQDGVSRLTIGQFVRAEIAGKDFDSMYELPRVALHNGDSVYVVDPENRLRERKVTLLDINDENILVAEGLDAGEVVTVSPMTSGVDGIEVVSLGKPETES